LPSLFTALLPIVLPVLFITAATIFSTLSRGYPALNQSFHAAGLEIAPGDLLNFFGEPTIALLISAVVSMALVARQKGLSRRQLGTFTGQALDEAGMILLITCAGGAFGAMLQRVGVGDSLRVLSNAYAVPPLVLGWAIAALFKIAQGSGTVSMVAASEILADIVFKNAQDAGLSVPDYLGYDPVFLVMAVGFGSKVGSWMNDSGFWVVARMGNLTEGETLRGWTMCLVAMGVTGLPVVWLLTKVFAG
jgi:GntP family gluconate:H+ symporter